MKQITVRTERLEIMPRSAEEIQALRGQETDAEMRQAYQEMLDTMAKLPGQEEWGSYWTIRLHAGQNVGGLCFMGPPDESGTVELGYGIDEPFQRQGYACEAVGGITDWALSQKGVCTVTAQTAPDNAASQRVLAKNGFTRNGDGPEGPLFERK